MNYNQTLDYLFSKLPMYQRIGAAAYKADLNNTIAICSALGNPQNKLKCIHVAGTNGKGSTSHMLAAVLQKSGYRVGLYTSPHLVDFRERIKVNGKLISKEFVIEFVEKYKETFEKIEPSFFEWTVGLCFDYFLQQEVDIAVIEVGLGGRLDSTNVIDPLVSVITNIGYDHVNLLGDSLKKIAGEKAGIIKSRKPVIVSEYQSETASVFSNRARELKCPVEFGSKNYKVLKQNVQSWMLKVELLNRKTGAGEVYELDLTGSYQVKNLCGVLSALKIVSESFFISEQNIKDGLRQVTKLTGIQGRWQQISEKPLIICDTGHNEDGIKEVLHNLSLYKFKQLHFVLGMVNDKDVSSILKLLPKKASYYFTKASIPRALDAEELKSLASVAGLKGEKFGSVNEAVKAAKKKSKKDDLIFIGGSTFVVADALKDEG
jgi:dihydrofolate synthase / folylpolyglutamate synthase